MLVAGRSVGWARSAVAISRCTRLSQHVTHGRGLVVDSLVRAGVQEGVVSGADVRHRSGRRKQLTTTAGDTAAEEQHTKGMLDDYNPARSPAGVSSELAQDARGRLGGGVMRGQERSKSTATAAAATKSKRHGNGGSGGGGGSDGGSIQSFSHNSAGDGAPPNYWVEYQEFLQASAGLLPGTKSGGLGAMRSPSEKVQSKLSQTNPAQTTNKGHTRAESRMANERLPGTKSGGLEATRNPSETVQSNVRQTNPVQTANKGHTRAESKTVNERAGSGSAEGAYGRLETLPTKRRYRRELTRGKPASEGKRTAEHVAEIAPARRAALAVERNEDSGATAAAVAKIAEARSLLALELQNDANQSRHPRRTNGKAGSVTSTISGGGGGGGGANGVTLGKESSVAEIFEQFTAATMSQSRLPNKAASDSQRTPRGTYGFDVQHTRLRTANAGSGSTNGLGSGSSSSNGGRGRLTLGGRQTARAATQEQQPGPPPRVKVRASKLAARLRAGLPRKKLIPPPPVPLNGVTIKAAKRRARKEREMGSIVQRPVVITNGTGFEGQLGVSSDKLEEIDRFLFDVGSDTQGADIAPVGRGTNAGYQSPKTVESSAASAQGTATDGPDNLDFVDFQHPREMKAVPAPFVTKSLKQARREIPPWQRKQARRILSAELPRIDKPVWDTSAPRSAEGATLWMNVHSRNNLKKLLDGLDSDYGVTARAKECFVSKPTLMKVMPIFRAQVLDAPDTSFPGHDAEMVKNRLVRLCNHQDFRADAVTRKKPQRVWRRLGRAFNFDKMEEQESGFIKERADMVESIFVPRLVDLANELFPVEVENARKLLQAADLTDPHNWFPLARLRKRKIIYHGGTYNQHTTYLATGVLLSQLPIPSVGSLNSDKKPSGGNAGCFGPTNSGKTYNAINRLKQAGAERKTGDKPVGLFCGPLRLLALEIYEQLNSEGFYCSLNTGQERRDVPFATHLSCTIEMASMSDPYEVAVIDEIQMVDDPGRGQHWTAALLGLNCPEIHVCGGLEAAKLVETMCKEMGDDFELHEYERKTPLVAAEESLKGSYAEVQPGDAVVAFSRKEIFMIKAQIEAKTKYKCCVVYGQLPQETRAHQARLFNTKGTGYDVLVASDAIGMGLNLNIRRIIFHSVQKNNGLVKGKSPLSPTLLKQIGGRAGRHGKDWEFGEVTCLYEQDMPFMQQIMATPLEQIPQAHLFPLQEQVQVFADSMDLVWPMPPGTRRRLVEIMEAIAREAKVPSLYTLGEFSAMQKIADALHNIDNLTVQERFTICNAPASERNEQLVRAVACFALAHAERIPAVVNMHLPARGAIPRTVDEFAGCCDKHSVLEVYKWMSQRFPGLQSPTQLSLATRQQAEVVNLIYKALQENIKLTGRSLVGMLPHDFVDPSMTKDLHYPDEKMAEKFTEVR